MCWIGPQEGKSCDRLALWPLNILFVCFLLFLPQLEGPRKSVYFLPLIFFNWDGTVSWNGFYLSFRNLPAVNLINIIGANFLYKCLFGSFFYVHTYVRRKKLPNRWRTYEKFVRKMLMKLTPDCVLLCIIVLYCSPYFFYISVSLFNSFLKKLIKNHFFS